MTNPLERCPRRITSLLIFGPDIVGCQIERSRGLSRVSSRNGGEGSVTVLSRRNALRGMIYVGLTRAATAQVPRNGEEAEIALVAPDTGSMQIANGIAARLGGSGTRLHAEASRGVADAVFRLPDRLHSVAAILPSTALAFMQQTGTPSREVHANRYIAQLDLLTFQVLASQRVSNPQQLAGRKVNLGPLGSPTQVSASVMLEQSSLRVDPLYLDHPQACSAVIRGEIAAMVLLAPKPTRLFLDVDASDGVHFLPMPEPKNGRATGVVAAQILPTDYPMIAAGSALGQRSVNTIAIPLLMGCFGWAAETPNSAAMTRLADLLAQRGSGLPGFDMTATVSGWQRFAPVANWLARGRSGLIRDYADADTRPAASRERSTVPSLPSAAPSRPAPAASADPEQKEKLFREFLNWRRNN